VFDEFKEISQIVTRTAGPDFLQLAGQLVRLQPRDRMRHRTASMISCTVAGRAPPADRLRAGFGNVCGELRASPFRNPVAKNSQEALLFFGGPFVCGINGVGEGWHQ
jgi:hypothetical protein